MSRITALVLLLLAAVPAAGQHAAIFLEPGHWTYDAIRRLNVAGMAPASSDPALAPVTRQHARAVFAYAAGRAAERDRPDLVRLSRGYQDRLAQEADSAGVLAAAELRAGWFYGRGEALSGAGFFPEEDWTGAQPLAPLSDAGAGVRAHGFIAPWLSWNVDGGYLAGDWVVPAATIAVALGPFDVWAGRRRLHYGSGRGGGLVLGSGMNNLAALAHRTLGTFDGIGIHVREPFHFPWHLRVLGPDRIEVVAGRLSRHGRIEDPFLVFGRLIGTPFSRRFTLGINRGAIFGGDGPGRGISPSRLLGVLVGVNSGAFENQVFSAVFRYRPPLGPLPLEAYFEFGTDDASGALRDVPGFIAGFDLGAVPGLTPLSLGFEHARYYGSCCGNPPWYRNVFFRGSWSDDGRLFAHPLAGHGREWLAHSRIDLPDLGVLLRVDGFARWRGHENLLAPERAGRSWGALLSLDYQPGAATGVRLEAGVERASTWRQHRAALTVSHEFAAGGRDP